MDWKLTMNKKTVRWEIADEVAILPSHPVSPVSPFAMDTVLESAPDDVVEDDDSGQVDYKTKDLKAFGKAGWGFRNKFEPIPPPDPTGGPSDHPIPGHEPATRQVFITEKGHVLIA